MKTTRTIGEALSLLAVAIWKQGLPLDHDLLFRFGGWLAKSTADMVPIAELVKTRE